MRQFSPLLFLSTAFIILTQTRVAALPATEPLSESFIMFSIPGSAVSLIILAFAILILSPFIKVRKNIDALGSNFKKDSVSKRHSFLEALIDVMCHTADADKPLSDAKIETICRVFHDIYHTDILPSHIEAFQNSSKAQLNITKLSQNLSDSERKVLLQAAVMVAASDTEHNPKAYSFIRDLARHFGQTDMISNEVLEAQRAPPRQKTTTRDISLAPPSAV
jgi:tellurite resistance protein